jgi:small conductance mechanosensitive channel
VDTFDDASFTVRLLIKTKPGEQWRTRREFRRRVKARFDAEGIAAPFAYRVETRAGRA